MNKYHRNWSTELCFATIEVQLSSSASSFVTSTLTCLHCSSQVVNKRYCSVIASCLHYLSDAFRECCGLVSISALFWRHVVLNSNQYVSLRRRSCQGGKRQVCRV